MPELLAEDETHAQAPSTEAFNGTPRDARRRVPWNGAPLLSFLLDKAPVSSVHVVSAAGCFVSFRRTCMKSPADNC